MTVYCLKYLIDHKYDDKWNLSKLSLIDVVNEISEIEQMKKSPDFSSWALQISAASPSDSSNIESL